MKNIEEEDLFIEDLFKEDEKINIAIPLNQHDQLPNNACYYLEQSNAMMFSGNSYAALKNAENAINLRNDYSAAYYQKARILFVLDRKAEAESCFEQASRLDGFLPGDEAAQKYYYKALASYYIDNKILLEGGSNIMKYVVSYDDYKLYCSNSKLGLPVHLNSPANKQIVLNNYDRAIKHNPFDVENYYKKAVALIIIGKFEEALNMYDQIVSLQPGNPLPYYSKSIVLLAMNMPELATRHYDYAKTLKLPESSVLSKICKPEEDVNHTNILVQLKLEFSFSSFKDEQYSFDNESPLLGEDEQLEEYNDL
jgi:tetratricopeptide (TPR) repeat protein